MVQCLGEKSDLNEMQTRSPGWPKHAEITPNDLCLEHISDTALLQYVAVPMRLTSLSHVLKPPKSLKYTGRNTNTQNMHIWQGHAKHNGTLAIHATNIHNNKQCKR